MTLYTIFETLILTLLASGDTDPFFSFVSFNAIHSPFDAPDSSHLEEFNNIPNSASTR